MTDTTLYVDKWGEIIDRADAAYVEIRWYDATSEMTVDEFNQWLTTFATQVESKSRPGVLVDGVQFRMPMERMDAGWRDTHIVPRYNAAGLKKFAFLMPEGMPAIGTPPTREGPAHYPTGYFGTRAAALAWLAE